MQCLITNGVVLTLRLSIHQVFLLRDFTVPNCSEKGELARHPGRFRLRQSECTVQSPHENSVQRIGSIYMLLAEVPGGLCS